MRVTTNGTLMGYKSSLMRSSNNLNAARNKVLTQRNFNTYAEDPAAASEAFKLRRMFSRTNDQISNNSTLVSKYESAWTSAGSVKELVAKAAKEIALTGESDPIGAGRQPLGEVLANTAKSIVQTLNTQYADNFVFGGANADKTPFSWDEKTGGLLFQGVSVDEGLPGAPKGQPPHPDKVEAGSAWAEYYAKPGNEKFVTLAKMANETQYIDIGAGLSAGKDGALNPATAFNGAISGLNILGFGKDADGDSNNVVSLIKELSDIYKKCDPSSGAYASTEDEKRAGELTKKLDKSLADVTNKWVELDGQAQYLKANKERLTETSTILNEQILDLEQVNLADAITEFSWAQYCYNSALKVGNSILSQSLIDYMN